MKFKFCGDADCPDWILAEINTLSKLSSVKLKLLAQIVAQGIVNPPIDMEKAEKIFSDSKLDVNIDLKACIACVTHIIKSAVRFNCDSNALHSELQQLGLPREHSTSIKRVTDDQTSDIAAKLRSLSLKVNRLENVETSVDNESNCAILKVNIEGAEKNILLTPFTVDVLLKELKSVRESMVTLSNTSALL